MTLCVPLTKEGEMADVIDVVKSSCTAVISRPPIRKALYYHRYRYNYTKGWLSIVHKKMLGVSRFTRISSLLWALSLEQNNATGRARAK